MNHIYALTIEQIILLLEKVTNTKYINKNELISILINKNYNKLIKRAKKEKAQLLDLKGIRPYTRRGV